MSLAAGKIKSKPKSKGTHPERPSGLSPEALSSRHSTQSPSPRLGAFYSCGPALGLSSPAQTKLTIGKADDPFEREADAISDRIASGQSASHISPISSSAPQNLTQRQQTVETEHAEEEDLSAEEPLMQMPIQSKEEDKEPQETTPIPMHLQRKDFETEKEPDEAQPLALLVRRQEADDEGEQSDEEPLTPDITQRQEEEQEQQETAPTTMPLQRMDFEAENEPEAAPIQKMSIQRMEVDNQKEQTTEEPLMPFPIQRQNEEEEPELETTHVQALQLQPSIDNETDNKLQAGPLRANYCSECSNRLNDSNEDHQVQRIEKEESELDDTELQAQQYISAGRSDSATRASTISKAMHNPGAGDPLKPSIRERMEAGLGIGIGDVRVHSDGTSHDAARALKARAFTHGNEISLGAGQSQDDTRLMAHELTHVVQQTSENGHLQSIQRKPSDYRHLEDGGGVRNRLQIRFDEEIDESEIEENGDSNSDAHREYREIDRSELRNKTDDIKGETRPDVDRPAAEKPGVDRSAQQVERETGTPGDPLVEEEEPEEVAEKEGAEKEPLSIAEQAAALADEAFASAENQTEPSNQMEVVPPAPVSPVDSKGEPLAGDLETESQIADLAQRAQTLREQGTRIRGQAAEEHGNAQILRGNLERVSGEIGKAEEGIATSKTHSEFRQQLKSQAEEALVVSEEKASLVSEQAPDFSTKSDEGKEDTGPMSQETSDMSARNAEKEPEDPEAAAKSREQGQKINSVGSDAATMDDAVTQTKEKADTLAQDAERAAEMNTQSQEKISETEEKLNETNERLTQMRDETREATAKVDNLRRAPAQVTEQANQLDQRGLALISASFELENRLQNVQRTYEQGMGSVPAIRPWEGEEESALESATEEMPIQATPENGEEGIEAESDRSFGEAVLEGYLDPQEGRYEEREQINIGEALPGWLTGVDPASEEQREEAREREEQRRQNEVDQINEWAGGRFEDLDGADKMGIALRLVGQNFHNSISNISWPGWGGLAKMLIDPRTMLMGVVSGLGMMLSGAANLFSAEQWIRDPLGNLLKSAADIATGLTIILGSITALAGLIAAIMGALILITFGAFSPIGLPVISVCTTIITTVGGWTIAVGKIALVLQALSLIKNLVDAATAGTAANLQNQSDQIRADTVAAGTVVLSIVGAKGAAAGIRGLRRRALQRRAVTRRAGGLGARARALGRLEGRRVARGARAVGRGVASGAGAVRQGVRAVGGGVARGARAVGRGALAVGRGVSRSAQTIGRGIAGGARAIGRGARGMRERVSSIFGRGRRRRVTTERTLAEAPATLGHRVRVTSRGNVDLCSSCTNMSLVYREVLDQNPRLQSRFTSIREKARQASQMDQTARATGNTRLLREAERKANAASRDAARLERKLAETGIIRGGQRFKAEPALFKNRKHGIEWENGPRRLRETGKPQGQFGQARDIHFSVERGAGLGPGRDGHFRLPPDHDSFVWVLRNGNVVRARAEFVYVKVRADGTIHAFPELSSNI